MKKKSAAKKQPKILHLLGWVITLALVFALGNLTGNALQNNWQGFKLPKLKGRPQKQTVTNIDANSLKPPGPQATEEEKDNFYTAVNVLAKETNTIVFNDCIQEPKVARVNMAEPLVLVNQDSKEIVITTMEQEIFLKPQEEGQIEIIGDQAFSIYGLTCNNSESGYLITAN
jgi:hypothetical protein